jgi:hypothetical protein
LEKHVVRGNPEKIPLLLGLVSEAGYQQVWGLTESHLEELRNKMERCCPSLSTEVCAWVRSPHSDPSAQPGNLALREEEELCELQSDHALNMRFTDISLYMFWISVEDYAAMHKEKVKLLLQFSTSHVCEQDFSCLTSIKSKTEIVSFQLRMNSVYAC